MAKDRPDLKRNGDTLKKTKAYKASGHTTSGDPNTFEGEDGGTYSSLNIDEGNLSQVHYVENKPYVTVQEKTTNFPAGFKLYINE
jgi:hypothetical protein